MKTLLTDKYKAQLQRKHATSDWGNHGASWLPKIIPIIEQHGGISSTVLDYGCGTGTLKQELNKLMPGLWVEEYDPGIPRKDLPPRPAQIVVCTDVMEHVEPEFVDATLRKLSALTLKACFFVIACQPAKQTLPDGRNAHLTIKPPLWWQKKLRSNFIGEIVLLEAKSAHRLVCVVTK